METKQEEETSPERPAPAALADSPYAPLYFASFRWMVLSIFAIALASQVIDVAVALQIYVLTKDPLALGMIGLAQALPFIAVALFAGHAADTGNRQRLALGSLAVLFACSAGLVVLSSLQVFRGIEWAIYGVLILSGVARSFLGPARTALSAEVVPRELYVSSVTWRTGTWQIAAVTGPALGGLLCKWGGERLAYAVAVALAGAAFILQAMVRATGRARPSSHESILESLKEGISFLLHKKVILSALSLDLFAVLFGGAVALLPIYAEEILKVGPDGLGYLRAAPALGAVVMSIAITRFGPFRKAGVSLLISVAVFGFCMIAFGVSTSYPLSLSLLALSGAVDYISVVIRHTLVQVLTPERMLGRIAAVNSIFIGSSNEIGAFESGAAAKLFGTVPSVVAGGIVTLAVVAFTAWRVPELRDLQRISGVDVTESK